MAEKIIDLEAYRKWRSWPQDWHDFYLNNDYCPECSKAGRGRVTSFADDYTIRQNGSYLVLEGTCIRCGSSIVRVCD